MERRNHQRRQLARYALLYHPHGFLCPCSINNVSFTGLFIRTKDARIFAGNCVDVAIDASPHKAKPITTKAMVVHKTADGVGLLCESDIPLHDLLRDPQ